MTVTPYADSWAHLDDELRRLDLLIQLRLATVARQNDADPRGQAARAVYITRDEVEWLLTADRPVPADDPTTAAIRADLARLSAEIGRRVEASNAGGVSLTLPALGQLFGLSETERRALVVCLAPELRRTYDRLYAYLQDDITRKRPSVDLVLELLCDTEEERWHARAAFFDTAPLFRGGLLERVDDPHSPSGSSGLAQFLALDRRVCRYLLGNNEPDPRLAGRVRLEWPAADAPAVFDPALAAATVRLVERHGDADRRRLVVHLRGPAGAGKRDLAAHACAHLGVALLTVDVGAVLAAGGDAGDLLRLTLREGLLQQGATYLDGAVALSAEAARPALKAFARAVAEYGWLVFLGTDATRAGDEVAEALDGCLVVPVDVPMPGVPLRAEAWRRALHGRAAEAGQWSEDLAARYRLTPGRIRAAADLAEQWRRMAPEPRPLAYEDLSAACRQQSGQRLADLAVKVDPRRAWDDLVLPAEKAAHLREICDQVRHHWRVFGAWGFDGRLGHGKGLSVLFSGPPGTGKTLAAEVMAGDVGLDLYKVDLSGVVSKYVGETEKNLSRVFEEARAGNAILFFDEADALFGKRTEASDAHDRYANIETSYLLQKMEEYEGIVILATNLRQNMDEAFTRRIRFVVDFPFPDADGRERIWRGLFPPQAPLGADVEFDRLARDLPLAGGNIKNIALNAAFLAAADAGASGANGTAAIGARHIRLGARREFEKIGKLWSE